MGTKRKTGTDEEKDKITIYLPKWQIDKLKELTRYSAIIENLLTIYFDENCNKK